MTKSSVGVEIVEQIAEREGVDPVDLDVPLYEAVDPDALEALTNGAGDRQSQTNVRVEFSYSGYTVTVVGSGKVSIDEQPMETKMGDSVGVSGDDSH